MVNLLFYFVESQHLFYLLFIISYITNNLIFLIIRSIACCI